MKRAQLLKIGAQVSVIWAKVCALDDCVDAIRLDMTLLPHLDGERSHAILLYYHNIYTLVNECIPRMSHLS